MSSYPKLDELMTNLEESSDRMSDLIGVIETINELKEHQESLLTGFESAKKEIGEAASQFTQSKDEVIGAAERLKSSGVQLEKTATATAQRVTDSLVELQHKVDTRLKAIQDALDSGMAAVKRENREQYTDLEKLVRLKLDENKADVKQFIEHERGQIATLIDTRSQAVENFIVVKTDEKIVQLIKNQQSMQTTLWILGSLLVVVLAKLFGLFS